MTTFNVQDYNINIHFGKFEGEYCFKAKVKEFPNIAEYADTYEEAYTLVIDSIEALAEIYAEQNKTLPRPTIINNDHYDCRVRFKMLSNKYL